MIETSGYTNMKKKFLSLLLLPLALSSCGKSPLSLEQMREKVSVVSDAAQYPYYKVVGSIDFNNQVLEVDAEFSNEPGYNTFVPYSRYNDGFYNATVDTSEPNVEDIIIYSLASKSYWLRAPLRIHKSNFYSEVYTIAGSTMNGGAITIDLATGNIGSITMKDGGAEKDFVDASITAVDAQGLTIRAYIVNGEEKEAKDFAFTRSGAMDENLEYAGEYTDQNQNKLVVTKGTRENTTCAHYLLQHIITSYIGQTGSTNPSKNQMKMTMTADGGYVFYGEAVHSQVMIDNFPYYPDPNEHPEIGEWDPEYPIPCYKNRVNAKVDIRLEYNAEGWLVKEEMSSTGYDYNVVSASQVALKAVYGYKFS